MNNLLQLWQRQRHADVTSRFGDLALEALIEVNAKQKFEHIPGTWGPVLTKTHGLKVNAMAEDGLRDERGEIIEGELELEADQNFVAFSSHKFAMATYQPGSPYLLAIYDEHHESLARFEAIACYPENTEHIYVGHYMDVEDKQFEFHHTGDVSKNEEAKGRIHSSTSVIAVEIAGTPYQLRPFASGEADIIVFRDETSNDETYSVGRMIVAERLSQHKVKLDFNKAFLPPCAFSPHFNCPMPPLSNRIKTAIKAGEKNVDWKRE